MNKLIPLSTALMLIFGVGVGAEEPAQQQDNLILKTQESRQLIKGPAEYFTGQAWIDPFHLEAQSQSVLTSAQVTFEPGARTNWHIHPRGQLLVVTSGKGWTQLENGKKITINEGDTVWCPPDHRHWHGATSTTSMSHIAIQEKHDGTNVHWMEAVSDNTYLSDN